MSHVTSFAVLLSALALPAAVHAQHHHDSGHRSGSQAYHHGSNWGHSNWSHVVPSHTHYGNSYRGSYYSTGNSHYYTPTAVTYATTANYAPPPVQAPVQLSFAGFTHLEDLSGRLEADANNFCLDLYHNYQHNPGFAEVYREAYQILQAAKYVHAKEHQGDRAEIARQVTSIDQLFHHVQQKVPTLARDNHRQIGMGDALTKAQNLEAVLHHLAYNVGVEPHSAQAQPGPAPGSGGREEAPPPPAGQPQTSPPPAGLR